MESLYDDVMMEHIKNVRNYREIELPTNIAKGTNPLCGDQFSIFLKLDNDIIVDLSFQCECCGISMASASMMTEVIKGNSLKDARKVIAEFKDFMRDNVDSLSIGGDLAAVAETVVKFPSRINCALLGWKTLETALKGEKEITVK